MLDKKKSVFSMTKNLISGPNRNLQRIVGKINTSKQTVVGVAAK